MARDLALQVDEPGFHELMDKQREQSRLHWKGSGEREISEAYRQLSAQGMATVFQGYERLETDSSILALVRDGEIVTRG